MSRTHDRFYLNENRYVAVREHFKFCRSFIRTSESSRTMLDVGCANGEFQYFLVREFPADRLIGLEHLPELVEKARKEVPQAEFLVGSVLESVDFEEQSADVTTMVGVHSIWDDPFPAFDNLIHWTKPGGRVIVFGLFNPYAVDAFVRVRTPDQPEDHRESGWSVISAATTAAYLKRHPRVKNFNFTPFNISIDLLAKDDPLRSWTQTLNDGSRQIINGIGLIHCFQALVVDLG